MGVEKSFGDVVGILVVIHMLVVPTVVGNPGERAVLKGGGPEDQRHQSNRPTGLEGHV